MKKLKTKYAYKPNQQNPRKQICGEEQGVTKGEAKQEAKQVSGPTAAIPGYQRT